MLERRTLLAGVAASCFLAANANAQWSELFKRGESLLRGDSERDEPGLSEVEITLGLKEALHIGATRVIRRVGRVDGYNDDPDIRLPLPGSLRPMQYAFRTTGVSGLLDDLQLRLNRAAEVSAPKTKNLFANAVRQMHLFDVRRIYDGPEDAATRYFQITMTPELAAEMRPIVDSSLSEVGAVQAFGRAMELYDNIPIAPGIDADIAGHVVEKGIEGIFHYLAKEEAEIRKNPVKRTTKLLRRVFGAA